MSYVTTDRTHVNTLKSVIREPYAWPGGYERFLITSDGAVICHQCAKDNYKLILDSTRTECNDGWQVSGASMDCETDGPVTCDHCSRFIVHAPDAVVSETVRADLLEFLALNWANFVSDAVEYDGLDLTVACDSDGTAWNYQTGDNSFTGGAYGLPHWAVVTIAADTDINNQITDISELVTVIIDQLNELLAGA